ncbi:MAG: D-alanine--D-alanine ligase [Gammaproteobacteria bacterium]|nr:D-alanine--D-alanine ligase [Gammaproteobacteria bacterium]MYJ51979.1 D-alanine--D-alanine ligase [Gammaproteobacteria bacterium]
MTDKFNLAILFGGRSCEHEVSVTSARSILPAINRDRYDVYVIGIDKQGHWHLGRSVDAIAEREVKTSRRRDRVTLDLHQNGNLSALDADMEVPRVDVIFPVLHGTFGEDGTIQGLFEVAGIPYVGCGVAASSLAMDKALAKRMFASVGLPQAPYAVFTLHEWQDEPDAACRLIGQELGYPAFVKPANLGSSVGISKARDRAELTRAIDHAFEFDNKIVVEQSMENCHEIECSVLGNHQVEASALGEIVPGAEFYNYETKYLDDKTDLVVPAPLDEDTTRLVRELAVEAFRAVDGKGLARVDFFVHRDTREITLNEINTLPGFTPISMYPRLWVESGLAYADLIDRLIDLALENHALKQRLNHDLAAER